jgi:hypothetical protein
VSSATCLGHVNLLTCGVKRNCFSIATANAGFVDRVRRSIFAPTIDSGHTSVVRVRRPGPLAFGRPTSPAASEHARGRPSFSFCAFSAFSAFSPLSRHLLLHQMVLSRPWDSHKIFLGIAACDCTCKCWGNAGIPQDMRQAPNRRIFPGLSHRINVLTATLLSRVAWHCLRMERAMGIENTAGAHSPFGIMELQTRRELRAIFV